MLICSYTLLCNKPWMLDPELGPAKWCGSGIHYNMFLVTLVTGRIRDETQCRVEDILKNKEDDETRALVEPAHQLEHRHRVVLRQAWCLQAVLRIHDILGRIRIRIRGSMPLTNGSGSCYFRHPPSRCQQKTKFLTQFFLLITFSSYIYIISQR